MTTYKTDEAIIHALWAVHEAFRRLGFSADDIFVSCAVINPSTRQQNAGAVLLTQGKEFSAFVAPVADPKAFLAKWQAFLVALPSLAEEELRDIWEKSEVRMRGVELIMALEAKGIHCRPNASLN